MELKFFASKGLHNKAQGRQLSERTLGLDALIRLCGRDLERGHQ